MEGTSLPILRCSWSLVSRSRYQTLGRNHNTNVATESFRNVAKFKYM
jgi:hypothetical protein